MPKNVLVLNHFAVPKGYAGHTRHVELFDRLGDGWEYTLVAGDRSLLSRKRTYQTAGSFRAIRTTPYRRNGLDRIVNWISYAFGALWFGIRQRRIDVVYASSPHLLAGLVGYTLARIHRAGFVLEIRDIWPRILVDMGRMKPTSIVFRIVRQLELFLYRHAGEIVVLAEGSRDAISPDCPPDTKISFLPNGSDRNLFAVNESRSALRRRFGLEGFVFVYAGAHGPANGLDLLLDAAEGIQQDLPQVKFILVGDGLEKHNLVGLAEARSLSNVRFFDPVPKSELPQLFKAADVGLHVLADVPLFRYGVSPNKLFDYMAAGLPVVTNCPGEVEALVDEAGAGLAVTPGGLEEAVRVMASSSDSELARWGQAGQTFIEEHRSHKILAARLLDVLNRAVK